MTLSVTSKRDSTSSPPAHGTLPTFIVVGTQKSGTTTLQHHLSRHPDVYMAPNEVHFFTRYFDRGTDWYRAQFAEGIGRKAVGEKTPTYSSIHVKPEAPSRIAAVVPDAKLVWIFREPVVRAHSHWWHAVRAGSETLGFEAALAEGQARLKTTPARAYLERSAYVEQVRAYLDHFPREAMYFCLLEDLARDPDFVIRPLLAFIGVDPNRQPALRSEIVVNTGSGRDRGSLRAFFRGLVRVSQRHVRRSQPTLAYEALDDALWRRLAERFVEHNRELAALTGLDLQSWRSFPDAAEGLDT